jgi:hypothetical protein
MPEPAARSSAHARMPRHTDPNSKQPTVNTRTLLLSSALLITSACATKDSPPSPPPRVRPPTCSVEAFRRCDPPIPHQGEHLGATELHDAENRARWRVCIERHTAWLTCAQALIEKGLLRLPEGDR